MKISINWLKDYIELEQPLPAIVEKLTMGGVEVEEIKEVGITEQNIVVGEIVSWEIHPNADRLRLCQVFTGTETLKVVCGAKNFDRGDKVALALPGAVLPGGIQIGERKIRGERSYGMLCSEKELGLSDASEGIMILSKDAVVGSALSSIFPKDHILDLEITPNRSDLLSYIGIARELAALGSGKLKALSFLTHQPFEIPARGFGRLTIENEKKCPFYSGCLLENVHVGPSPHWLASRLKASGFRPINVVVDITNYVLLETGEPLHAFDADRFGSFDIHIRDGRLGEIFVGLDGGQYELNESDLVISSPNRVEALAGVLGGAGSAISDSTTSVLLESAWFDPLSIQQSSTRLGVVSESSFRFSRKVDPQIVIPARNRAVELLKRLTGASLIDYVQSGTLPLEKRGIKLRKKKLEEFTVCYWPEEEVEDKLRSLGLTLKAKTEEMFWWEIPSFRQDLEIEEDLIEELVRLKGFSDFPSRIPAGFALPSQAEKEWDKVLSLKQVLASKGYHECITIPLVSDDEQTAKLSLSNPSSIHYAKLRCSFLDSLLSVANTNWRRGNKEIKIFEVGNLFFNIEGVVHEELSLGILVAGEMGSLHWMEGRRKVDFYDLKQIIDYLEDKKGFFKEDRRYLKEINIDFIRGLDLPLPCFYAEYSLEEWKKRKDEIPLYRPLPTQPSIRRDIAIIVDKEIVHEEILKAIGEQRVPFLETVELFDIFEDLQGSRIAQTKKSMTYALTFRAPDRTLTDDEINIIIMNIKEELKKRIGCSFRE
ncbi:phenylalanine--tRNA ligase subunit beta [Methylacidiphilum caldifontis]|uniref:Phenylalanine--tRNA ligase beta subunit n=1 Tax=Methylacidiphilum caldifontis TaxID=2795386 RepID=A0A4Y8PD13_9BACT|nr:phenylalanine--tRNA ligase subunit beta [Methylacidiphilum caldifontis]TFE68911.1 phenylalanine--tRNA ligase subunit beta [Methylacidiphilum caldifontis]